MNSSILRKKLDGPEIVVAPGVYDMMTLLIANQHSFDAHYASGYWGAASALGEPDVGIATYRDFITLFGKLAEKSVAPIVADADTGFGSLANLAYAVRGYQKAGIAAIQIEDQAFPKQCGHIGQVRLASCDEMVRRIAVAIDARQDGNMMIIARTDARNTEGLDSALSRMEAYTKAGADILFFEAPASEEEIQIACSATDLPIIINAAHGGRTPILRPSAYQDLGVSMVIYPAGAPLSAAYAADNFFAGLKQDDPNMEKTDMFDFADMSELLGMNDIIALQEKFKGV